MLTTSPALGDKLADRGQGATVWEIRPHMLELSLKLAAAFHNVLIVKR